MRHWCSHITRKTIQMSTLNGASGGASLWRRVKLTERVEIRANYFTDKNSKLSKFILTNSLLRSLTFFLSLFALFDKPINVFDQSTSSVSRDPLPDSWYIASSAVTMATSSLALSTSTLPLHGDTHLCDVTNVPRFACGMENDDVTNRTHMAVRILVIGTGCKQRYTNTSTIKAQFTLRDYLVK
jgi:hypothetical protein